MYVASCFLTLVSVYNREEKDRREWGVLIESQQKLMGLSFCVVENKQLGVRQISFSKLFFFRKFKNTIFWRLFNLFLSVSLITTAGDEDLVFTAEPQDAVVSKNSSVVIDCGVPAGWLRDMEEAGPAPFIEWKRDGVLLSLNGENRRYYIL